MKSHKEFMQDAKHANSLPAQTCRALAPESNEDIAMYLIDGKEQVGMSCLGIKISDVLCENHVGDKE